VVLNGGFMRSDHRIKEGAVVDLEVE